MRPNRVNFIRLLTALFALFAGYSFSHAQGITTSALSGFVNGVDGKPVAGATVTAVHEPSGTQASTLTRSNGQYDLSGLRVGGPYTVTVTATGLPTESKKDVYLALDQIEDVSFSAENSEVVVLEKFQTTETRDTTFGTGKTSNSVIFGSAELSSLPTIRRDIQDIANLDSRFSLVQNTSSGEFQLNVTGQNFRYNSFLIDGVQANDPFGLNDNGVSSLRSPVPLDAVQALNFDLSPYDVRRTGFTGALMNVVTKSGTNEYHGSTYYIYSDQDMRAKNPLTHKKDTFKERTYGLTIGGPIIKDKLFFFLAYDDYRKTASAPTSIFSPDAAQVQAIADAAKTKYNYDVGSLNGSGLSAQKTYLAKIDWNISQEQRFDFTYRRTDSTSPRFADNLTTSSTSVTGTTNSYASSLSNHWYQLPRINDTFTAKLNSSWTPDFSTEAAVSYSKYNGTPVNNGTPFPEVIINSVPGVDLTTGNAVVGNVRFGTERSRQLNQIYADIYASSLTGEYSWGDHKFTFGSDGEKDEITNRFIQYVLGQYTFGTTSGVSGVPIWQNAGTPTTASLSFRQAFLYPGYPLEQAFAYWSLSNYGAFIQDNWRPTQHLTITTGIRLDYPYTGVHPKQNDAFGAAGFDYLGSSITRNDTTNSGNYTIAPRFAFNYKFDTKRKTQLRGGIGIFQGRNPAVWLSNAYSNTGAIGSLSSSASAANPLTFTPTTSLQTGTTPQSINITDPKFKQPVAWKESLAFDYELPVAGLVLSLQTEQQQMIKAPYVVNMNLFTPSTGATVLPDGRNRYGFIDSGGVYRTGNPSSFNFGTATAMYGRLGPKSTFGDVLYMTDSNKGRSESYTIRLSRPMKKHWSFSAGYTHGHSTDVNPMTSSVAFSNWSGRTVFNPNENRASRSNYDTPDKVTITLTREFQFFSIPHSKSTASVVYRGQTGHPYSWVYYNDVNGDGVSGTDLLYVPKTNSDINADPIVTWKTQADHDNFLAYAQGDPVLSKYIANGGVVPRNGAFNAWQSTIDLHISQEVPIWKSVSLELFGDVMNLANMFNKKYGVVEGVDFPYTRAAVNASLDTTQTKYVYQFGTPPSTQTFTDLSRWQVQVGARLKF